MNIDIASFIQQDSPLWHLVVLLEGQLVLEGDSCFEGYENKHNSHIIKVSAKQIKYIGFQDDMMVVFNILYIRDQIVIRYDHETTFRARVIYYITTKFGIIEDAYNTNIAKYSEYFTELRSYMNKSHLCQLLINLLSGANRKSFRYAEWGDYTIRFPLPRHLRCGILAFHNKSTIFKIEYKKDIILELDTDENFKKFAIEVFTMMGNGSGDLLYGGTVTAKSARKIQY